MSEFSILMSNWRRMCDAYEKKYGDRCCEVCPLNVVSICGGCDAIYSDFGKIADWEKLEKCIVEWVACNPEPQYPTWVDWLESMDLISKPYGWDKITPNADGRLVCTTTEKAKEPMPEDIAQKLGLKPVVHKEEK